ncbi:MAG: hypothetical protein QM762_09270 [Chryseolinea sp.]
MKRNITLFMILFWSCFSLFAQEYPHADDGPRKKHKLSLFMANAFVPAAEGVSGQDKLFLVPAWGLNYDYWFHPKVAVGVHNDFILQQFKIESHDNNQEVVRAFPVVISGVVSWHPIPHWIILVGAGQEIDKHEHYNVVQAGVEYEIELRKGWTLGINLAYDNKINAYDTWIFGVTFGKKF